MRHTQAITTIAACAVLAFPFLSSSVQACDEDHDRPAYGVVVEYYGTLMPIHHAPDLGLDLLRDFAAPAGPNQAPMPLSSVDVAPAAGQFPLYMDGSQLESELRQYLCGDTDGFSSGTACDPYLNPGACF